MDYHKPVLLHECIEALNIKSGGIYVDATYGGGGHSKEILKKIGADGHLFGFDQDEDVLPHVAENERFTFVHHNFKYLKRFLKLHQVTQIDGVLADLGVSSHQLDEAERGFSFRFDAELDMRMNRQSEVTAREITNNYTTEHLQRILGMYGEVRNAKTLANAIVDARNKKPLETIGDLLRVTEPLVRGNRNRYLAQVFQALRIEVNDEMGALKTFLAEALEVLKPGGRLVVMSYHSLEDKLVKNFLKSGSFDGEVEKDFYGNIYRPFKLITKKPITPDETELKSNNRSRSVKLRIAEKK